MRRRQNTLTMLKEIFLYIISFLLAANLLLYAFFQVDINRNVIRACCAAICIVLFIASKKIKLTNFGFLMLAAYLILVNGDVSINMSFMIILAVSMRAADKRNVLAIFNKIHVVMFLVVTLSLLFGIVRNYNWSFFGRTRNTFGFIHVNYVGLLSFSIISIFVMYRSTIKWLELVLCFGISYAIYRYSDSRTGFYGVVLMLLLLILFKYLPEKYVKNAVILSIVILFLSPLVWRLPLLSNVQINYLLSRRPELFTAYIKQNSLFNLLFGGSHAGEIDNFYLLVLYNSGLFIYLGLFWVVLKSTLIKVRKKELTEVAFILSALVIAMMESSLLRPEIPCMTYFWMSILSDFAPKSSGILHPLIGRLKKINYA